MDSQCNLISNGLAWDRLGASSCVVLHSLQLLDAVAWSAVEHSIAVVDPGQLRPSGAMVRLLVFVSDQTPQKSLKR